MDIKVTTENLEETTDRFNSLEKEYNFDKSDPDPLTNEQEKELGIETVHGVKFDKDG